MTSSKPVYKYGHYVYAHTSQVAHMASTLDAAEIVITHGKSKFLSHEKVAKLIREAGGWTGWGPLPFLVPCIRDMFPF